MNTDVDGGVATVEEGIGRERTGGSQELRERLAVGTALARYRAAGGFG